MEYFHNNDNDNRVLSKFMMLKLRQEFKFLMEPDVTVKITEICK